MFKRQPKITLEFLFGFVNRGAQPGFSVPRHSGVLPWKEETRGIFEQVKRHRSSQAEVEQGQERSWEEALWKEDPGASTFAGALQNRSLS